MTAAVNSRVSFAELQLWPDTGRTERIELYDGEVIVVPNPFPRHQRVVGHLGDILRAYERLTGGMMFDSPIDIVFSEFDVVQPDLVFFRRDRRHLVPMLDATRVPPDLAVEVLSQSTERRDRERKRDMFARFGVPEYWIVDPVANRIEVLVRRDLQFELTGIYDDASTITSPTLPGLSFPVHSVFEQ